MQFKNLFKFNNSQQEILDFAKNHFFEQKKQSENEQNNKEKNLTKLIKNYFVVVNGKPGSGKTTIVKELLKQSFLVNNVVNFEIMSVVLIPNRLEQKRLNSEIANLINIPISQRLVQTPSAFAFSIVENYYSKYGKNIKLLSGPEQEVLIKNTIQKYGKKFSFNAQSYFDLNSNNFRNELRNLFTLLVNNNVSLEELKQLGLKHNKNWVSAGKFFESYLNVLKEQEEQIGVKLLDSSQITQKAKQIVGKIKENENHNNQLIIADNAQDLTVGDFNLLVELYSVGANIIIFSSPQTATQDFRNGISESFIEYLEQKIESKILAKSESFAQQFKIFELDNNASQNTNNLVQTEAKIYNSQEDQNIAIGNQLRQWHFFDKYKWQEMAVISRFSGSENISQTLNFMGIECKTLGESKPISHQIASFSLIKLLNLVCDWTIFASENAQEVLNTPNEFVFNNKYFNNLQTAEFYEVFCELLSSPFCNMGLTEISKIKKNIALNFLKENKNTSNLNWDDIFIHSFFSIFINKTFKNANSYLQEFIDKNNLQNIIDCNNGILVIIDMLVAGAKALEHNWSNIGFVLSEIIRASKVCERWQELVIENSLKNKWAQEYLEQIIALLNIAQRYENNYQDKLNQQTVTLFKAKQNKAFCNYIKERELPEDTLIQESQKNNFITICTPAHAVGKKFKCVIVPQLQEGKFPNLNIGGSTFNLDELYDLINNKNIQEGYVASLQNIIETRRKKQLLSEEKLFNLAISRASEKLLLMAVESENESVSDFFNKFSDFTNANLKETNVKNIASVPQLIGALKERALNLSNESWQQEAELLAYIKEFYNSNKNIFQNNSLNGVLPEFWDSYNQISTTKQLCSQNEKGENIVSISPSSLGYFTECGLLEVLKNSGYQKTEDMLAANVGTIIHNLAQMIKISEMQAIIQKTHKNSINTASEIIENDVKNDGVEQGNNEQIKTESDAAREEFINKQVCLLEKEFAKQWIKIEKDDSWITKKTESRAKAMIQNLANYFWEKAEYGFSDFCENGEEVTINYQVNIQNLISELDLIDENGKIKNIPPATSTITKRANSKIEKEFQAAFENIQKHHKNTKILFYGKLDKVLVFSKAQIDSNADGGVDSNQTQSNSNTLAQNQSVGKTEQSQTSNKTEQNETPNQESTPQQNFLIIDFKTSKKVSEKKGTTRYDDQMIAYYLAFANKLKLEQNKGLISLEIASLAEESTNGIGVIEKNQQKNHTVYYNDIKIAKLFFIKIAKIVQIYTNQIIQTKNNNSCINPSTNKKCSLYENNICPLYTVQKSVEKN